MINLLSNFDKECLRNVDARVFKNQMWTDGGQRPILKPEQSGELKKKNVTSRVFARKTAPPPWRPYINKTNVFSKFHNDWAKNVTSKTNVLTKFHESWAKNKTAQPTGGHVFSPIWTIFHLVRDINKTNVLTKFHDDLAKNENCPEKKVLTKFHEDWTKSVTSRVYVCFHYIQIAKPPTTTDINKTNVLTKFHDDWANIVTSRVFTCFHYIHIEKTGRPLFHDVWAKIMTSRVFTRKTATPTGGHHDPVSNLIEVSLGQIFKFHEERTRNVASRVFTNQMWTTDGRRLIT
ncbi:hypothetical protein DPMN_078873 [Dreissena polymorpha]|uniref:Uncharacterized protein n=1 Tax=Dreissena polymorpha TaxID=45954 RepID=A0A9D3YSN5_DREPO|nr:hypothetical protein DPMN_078873 [Dreissena polymorpha]